MRSSTLLLVPILFAGVCHAEPRPDLPRQAPSADAATPIREVHATFLAVDGRRSEFTLEVADTPDARARGLMYRRDLAADRGMVFVFPREEDQTFYMKNTYIPLDMVFIASDGRVVGVVEDARPLTRTVRSVGTPSRFVVELRAFTARSHGIGPGATVAFDPPLVAPAR